MAREINAYHWYGIDSNGKRVQGEIEAVEESDIKNELDKSGIMPISIRKKKNEEFLTRKKHISLKLILDFNQQIAKLNKAGIPLAAAIGIIQTSCVNNAAKNLFAGIKKKIEAGNSFSSVLKKYPRYFDSFFCNLISAGEKSGTLDTMLSYLAEYNEKIIAQKRKIKKILFYPAVVFIFAVVITIGLLIFVVPQFQSMFESFGATLPVYTQLIINLAVFLKTKGWLLFLGAFLFFAAIFHANKASAKFSEMIDKFVINVPYFGKALMKSIIARQARTLSITIKAGITLPDAIDMAIDIVENSVYKQTLVRIKEMVIRGQTLNYALEKEKIFPARVVQLITIGEESGTLDEMLAKIASYYEEEVDYMTDNLQSLLEPALMIFLGLIIGALVIGMYLPIFQLGKII